MAGKIKKGNIELTHNLYNILGKTLLDGVQSGRLDPNKLENLSANLGIDFRKGYGMDIGYNKYMGDRKQDLKISITKKF